MLTIDKVMWYTIRFTVVLFTLGFLVGCGGEPVECDDKGDCTEMKNLLKSQFSNMVRTKNAGSAATDLPPGSPVPNIQMNNLDPGLYTVQFEVLPPGDGNGLSAYAIVNWKVDGQPITRKLSVYSGAAISGVAESVDIQIVDYSDIVNGGGFSAAEYKIGASLSRGQRADIMQPPTLLTNPRAILVAATHSTTFVVPQGAGVTSVMILVATPLSGSANTNPLAVTAHGTDNVLAVTTASWYPITQGPGWIPIVPRTTSIIVQNFDTHDIEVQAIWGIEG